MSRRIDIELTSARPDGSWTWRAAGAREPKGVLDGSLLPSGAKPGSVLKADAEFELEGITVLSVTDPKAKSEKSGLLELLVSDKPFEEVTQVLAKRDASDRGPRRESGDRPGGPRGDRPGGPPRGDRPGGGPRGDRPPRTGDRPSGGRPSGDRPTGDRPGGDRPGGDRSGGPGGDRPGRPPRERTGPGGPGGDRRPPRDGESGERRGPRPERRQRPNFTPPPELPQRPKAKRLKPGRARRNAVLAELAPEQRPVAERALQGGIPAVRQAVQEQNARLRSEGKEEIPAGGVVSMAEQLLPRLRVAEWLDRADAAKADLEELDLRDLRSVVAAADDPMVSRDEETRALAAELKQALVTKQEKELQLWFTDIDAAIGVGRIIRALKLSSQPPKAGIRFPTELAKKLSDAAMASLTADAMSDRWSALLEAVAFSPVRTQVVPTARPENPSDDLLASVTRLAPLLPQVAALFGVEVKEGVHAPKPLRPTRPDKPVAKAAPLPPRPPKQKADAAATTEATDTPAADTETAVTEETAPAEETAVAEEAPPVETLAAEDTAAPVEFTAAVEEAASEDTPPTVADDAPVADEQPVADASGTGTVSTSDETAAPVEPDAPETSDATEATEATEATQPIEAAQATDASDQPAEASETAADADEDSAAADSAGDDPTVEETAGEAAADIAGEPALADEDEPARS